MKKLKVGIAGLGGVSNLHLRAYEEVEDIEIAAVSDINKQRVDEISSKYGVPGYQNCEDMFRNEKIDIACVLVPTRYHRDIVEKAAINGVNVLCEKPMSITLEDAKYMIDICKKNNVKLAYGASFRYLPTILKAKEIIDQGKLGNIMLMMETIMGGQGIDNFASYSFQHYPKGGPGGGGLGLVDHGIHMIDLFTWFTGSKVIKTCGRGNISGDKPQTEYLLMNFENGAVGELVYNEATYSADMPWEGIFSEGAGWGWDNSVIPERTWQSNPQTIRVYGENGALRIYPYANKLYFINAERAEEIIDMPGKPAPSHFAVQMEAFAEAIRKNVEPGASGQDGYNALATLLSAYK